MFLRERHTKKELPIQSGVCIASLDTEFVVCIAGTNDGTLHVANIAIDGRHCGYGLPIRLEGDFCIEFDGQMINPASGEKESFRFAALNSDSPSSRACHNTATGRIDVLIFTGTMRSEAAPRSVQTESVGRSSGTMDASKKFFEQSGACTVGGSRISGLPISDRVEYGNNCVYRGSLRYDTMDNVNLRKRKLGA